MHGSIPVAHSEHPESDQLEVTLFGSGYGESVVVHIGDGKWLILDSSINSDTKKPAALEYLEGIGVNISTKVKGVVVTHWHDDHIRGISEIAKKCSSAKFFISAALMCSQQKDKFLKLVLDSPISRLAHLNADSNSGVSEFRKLFEVLKENNNQLDYAIKDSLLVDEYPFQLWALSPHSTIYEKAIESIITQIPDKNGSVQRIRAPKPNYTSVVLWIKFGDIRALLGADLEESSEHKGWSLIISEKKSSIIDQKAELFKIAHHGSITGNHDGIWTELLSKNPLCLVAPFNRNPKLPTASDITRINGYSTNVYITSYDVDELEYKPSEDKVVRRKLLERKATYVHEKYSYVRARKKTGNDWGIDIYGNARLLSSMPLR